MDLKKTILMCSSGIALVYFVVLFAYTGAERDSDISEADVPCCVEIPSEILIVYLSSLREGATKKVVEELEYELDKYIVSLYQDHLRRATSKDKTKEEATSILNTMYIYREKYPRRVIDEDLIFERGIGKGQRTLHEAFARKAHAILKKVIGSKISKTEAAGAESVRQRGQPLVLNLSGF
jgi:hypothetical protein